MSARNPAASAYDRLLKLSREAGRPFQELLLYYGIERFLSRLSASEHRDKLILKGALMFHVWDRDSARATRDIDLLGKTDNDLDSIRRIVLDICAIDEADGLAFDPKSIHLERITEDADYEGVRVTFSGKLASAKVPMQLDIGFGDAVHPKPVRIEYPTILSKTAFDLKGYPREAVVAEKFEAMVKLGEINSRLKDFYDLWFLARGFEFDGKTLSQSLQKTFHRRGIIMDREPLALSPAFGQSPAKQTQWAAFLRRNRLEAAPKQFSEVVDYLSTFLSPIANAFGENTDFNKNWRPSKGWR